VGYVGLILNAHWAQMFDAPAGWLGFDPAGNDGRKLGLWPWQSDQGVSRPVESPTEETPRPRPRPAAEPRTRPEAKPKPEEQPKTEITPATERKPVTDQPVKSGRSGIPRGGTQGLVKDRDLQP